MMFFANPSIRSKIILAFMVILAFAASIGVFSITRMTLLNNDAMALENNVQGLEPLGVMSEDAHQMVEISAIGANESNPAFGQSMFGEVGKVQQEYTAQWGDYAPSMDPGQETMDGNNFNAAFNRLAASISQMAVQYEAGNHAGVTDLMNGDIKDELSRFATSMDDDLSYQDSQAIGLTKNAEEAAHRSILLISEASGRDRELVVEGLAAALAGLAKGNLTVRFGQAASLEETAAVLDEITATVRKMAEGATEARNVVSRREERCGAFRRGCA
jgi:methyl-accepting chemotaxis protein